MDKVTVRRAVVLKAIVTDRLKKELQDELQAAADELAERIRQIDMASKRAISDLQRTDLQRAMAVRSQIETEKRRQDDVRSAILQRKAEVARLELGSEFQRGTLESVAELRPGDNLVEALAGVEIIVKDDVIQEIRQLSVPQIEEQTVRAALPSAVEESPLLEVVEE